MIHSFGESGVFKAELLAYLSMVCKHMKTWFVVEEIGFLAEYFRRSAISGFTFSCIVISPRILDWNAPRTSSGDMPSPKQVGGQGEGEGEGED